MHVRSPMPQTATSDPARGRKVASGAARGRSRRKLSRSARSAFPSSLQLQPGWPARSAVASFSLAPGVRCCSLPAAVTTTACVQHGRRGVRGAHSILFRWAAPRAHPACARRYKTPRTRAPLPRRASSHHRPARSEAAARRAPSTRTVAMAGKKPLTHYEVLGVAMDAPAAEIREAYCKLAMKCHPDNLKRDADARATEEAEASFQQIVKAFQVLSDELRRATYDTRLRHNPSAARKEADEEVMPDGDGEVEVTFSDKKPPRPPGKKPVTRPASSSSSSSSRSVSVTSPAVCVNKVWPERPEDDERPLALAMIRKGM